MEIKPPEIPDLNLTDEQKKQVENFNRKLNKFLTEDVEKIERYMAIYNEAIKIGNRGITFIYGVFVCCILYWLVPTDYQFFIILAQLLLLIFGGDNIMKARKILKDLTAGKYSNQINI